MKITRRAITAGTTFFLAAATGHVMQSGHTAISQQTVDLGLAETTRGGGSSQAPGTGLPDFPNLQPVFLSAGNGPSDHLDDLEQGYSWPGTDADKRYDDYGRVCPAPALVLDKVAPAMLHLRYSSPCDALTKVLVHHAGLNFNMITDDKGQIEATIPAMAVDGLVRVLSDSGSAVRKQLAVPELKTVSRIALVSRADAMLRLVGGDMTITLGDPTIPDGYTTQIMTTSAGPATPTVSVQAITTAADCGQVAAGRTLSIGSGPRVEQRLLIAMPGCDAIGDRAELFLTPPPGAVVAAGN